MFKSARLQLTAWYLVIILAVSSLFSLIIYGVESNELERFAQVQRLRIERRIRAQYPLPPGVNPGISVRVLDSDLTESRRRLVASLLVINGSIFLLSGAAGYFLAGRTLRPIKSMVDEQKRFIGDASHELRTPITAIRSLLEVHIRGKSPTPAENRRVLQTVLTQVGKMQELTDSLLRLGSWEEARRPLDLRPVVASDVIRSAADQIRPLAKKKRIILTEQSEELTFPADFQAIHDLLLIILDNAVKYTPAGGRITIKARKDDGWAELTVTDNGIGIAPGDLPHLFDRFYRADAARKRVDSGGFGLGLAIAKKIVLAHRGRINLASQPDHGTTITVRLPMGSFQSGFSLDRYAPHI